MGFLKKLFDQANPFDGGKTWKNPNPVKPQPAQTPPPSYGGGVRGVTNWARDRFDANTPQDFAKRNAQNKAFAGSKNYNLTYEQQQAQKPNAVKATAQGLSKLALSPISSGVNLVKANVAIGTGNTEARNNALRKAKDDYLTIPKTAVSGFIDSPKIIGQGLAGLSSSQQNANKAQDALNDQLNKQKLDVYKRAKQGFNTQQDVDRFVKYADNLWNTQAQARDEQIASQKAYQSQIDPVKNTAAIVDTGLTVAGFGVAGATKAGASAVGKNAFETALKSGTSKQVATNLARKATRNEIIRQSALTGSMGGFQGAISPYAYKDKGTVTPTDVFAGATTGAIMGGVLPAAFVGASTLKKPVQSAINRSGQLLRETVPDQGGYIDLGAVKDTADAVKYRAEIKKQIQGEADYFKMNKKDLMDKDISRNMYAAGTSMTEKGKLAGKNYNSATSQSEKMFKEFEKNPDAFIDKYNLMPPRFSKKTTAPKSTNPTPPKGVAPKSAPDNLDTLKTNLDKTRQELAPIDKRLTAEFTNKSKNMTEEQKSVLFKEYQAKYEKETASIKKQQADIESSINNYKKSELPDNTTASEVGRLIKESHSKNTFDPKNTGYFINLSKDNIKNITPLKGIDDYGDTMFVDTDAGISTVSIQDWSESGQGFRVSNGNGNEIARFNTDAEARDFARKALTVENEAARQGKRVILSGSRVENRTKSAPVSAPIEKTPTVSKVTGQPSELLSNTKPVSKVTGKPSQLLAPNKVAEEATPPLTSEMGTQKTLQTQSNPIQETGMVDGSASSKTPVQEQGQPLKPTQKAEKIGSNTYTDSKQQRGFKSNIAKDTETPLTVYKDIPGYNVKPNAKTIGSAAQRVAKDPEGTYNRLLENGIQNTEDSADALVTLRNLVENDELDKASKLAKATAKAGTDFGQAVQIFSAFRKTTPDGALRDAWNIINNYNVKNPKKAPIRITSEQTKKITSLANDLQKTEYGTREWAVKAAQLEKEKGLLVPTSFLSKISTVQTMAQLLNPKTAIRNVVGNTVLDILEDVVRLPATAVDATLKSLHIIDSRNMVIPNMKSNWLNKYTGFKQGVEDVNLGIRTKGATGNYDIMKEVFKPGTVGNKLEKALGYELASMDKAFYTGRYQSSLENMMKAQKAKVPTPEMKSTAEAEALYATFQNNSNIAKVLTKSKNAMNVGKEWGVGDFILKYPKTPGNIVNVGLDYSPVGFVKGLKSLHDGIKLGTMGDVRNGELLLGRGLVGSGLILGGAFLAKQGIITGKTDSDPDKREADKMTGQGPFSFNVTALGRLLKGEDTKTQPGDVTANYDWLQPNAIQLSMGANMVINNGKADKQLGDGLDALGSGVDTISEQPVFSGVKQFFGNMNTQNGGGIGKATQGLASGIPASFTPSILNQAGQQLDNTKRSTYDPAPVTESWNKVKARLPGLRNTLLPAQNTLGQDMKQYDVGGNNPFNVFFNPSFLNRVSDSPTMQLVDGLNKSTGETSQYPRTVGKKQTFDGVKTQLSAQGLYDMKKGIGGQTDKLFTEFSKDPAFNALSDTDKVKALQGTLTDINASEKAKYSANNSLGQFDPNFTGKAGTLTKNQKSLINGDYNTSALASGMDIPKGLSQSATKILTSYSKDKANEPNNDPEVKTALKAWAGEDVPVNNETAKLWAEYEKDRVSNKLSPLEVDKRKKAVLKTAYSSGLNDFEKKYYSAADDDIIGALQKGDITEESLRKAMSVDANLVAKGVIKSSGFGKKVWNALGMSVPSVKGSVASGGKKSSGRKSSGKKSSGRKTAKSTKTNIYSLSKVNSRTKSTNNALRKLLGAAKI